MNEILLPAPSPFKDPLYSKVILYLPMDDAIGSTKLRDVSTQRNDFALFTGHGTIISDTSLAPFNRSFNLKGDGYWSAINPTRLGLGSGDFTIETFANIASFASTPLLLNVATASTGAGSYIFDCRTSGQLDFYSTQSGTIASSTRTTSAPASPLAANTWYHLAVSRISNTIRLFINGVGAGDGAIANAIFAPNTPATIGGDSSGYLATMKMSHLRVTKGVARYISNFNVNNIIWN